MGKKLAIKGHPIRGKEVIKLLEMLGGENSLIISGCNLSGYEPFNLYYINNNGVINCKYHSLNKDMVILTLEEFLEKYPFKAGDKVVYTKFGDNCDGYPVTIESMKWTGTTIEYTFNDCVTCLAKDLRMWNGEPEEPDKAKAPKLKGEDYSGKRFGYKIPDGYEFDVVVDGKIFLKPIKPKYPKLTNLTECKEILGEKDIYQSVSGYKGELLTNFQLLLIFRDAYWKIAGEELGLGKPWEPDWNDCNQPKFGIHNVQNDIHTITLHVLKNIILVFPTEKMRDAFYENFDYLIEACKELL